MPCAIQYHLFNLNNLKNTHGRVILLVQLQPATFVKVLLFRGCFFTFFKFCKWYQIAQSINWDKVFKSGPSKICGRQSLKNLEGYGLLNVSSRFLVKTSNRFRVRLRERNSEIKLHNLLLIIISSTIHSQMYFTSATFNAREVLQ